MRTRLIVSVFLTVVLSAPLFAQGTTRNRPGAKPAQKTTQTAPWQTNWRMYIAEIGKDLLKGVDPAESPRFRGKRVEFEGILKDAFDPAKPEETLVVKMEPQTIMVAAKLFPGVDAAAAGKKTVMVTIDSMFLEPAASNRDAWKSLKAGDKVRYRATLGEDAVQLVTAHIGGFDRGMIFPFAGSAEVLPAKQR
jgi:hypothetical protein